MCLIVVASLWRDTCTERPSRCGGDPETGPTPLDPAKASGATARFPAISAVGPTSSRHSGLVVACQLRGGRMAVFELSAHMTVRPGQLEGFKKQAAECIRITREQDTRTLRYDWFLSSDGECEVREAYTGPEGLIEHNRNILEARTTLFRDYADNHFMTVYGEPTQELLNLVKAHHLEHQFRWFSFVKGLDSSSD
jgi:quinol monooxygenase YgiN